MDTIHYYSPVEPQRIGAPLLQVRHDDITYAPYLVRIRKRHFTPEMVRSLDLVRHTHSHRIYHLIFYLDGANTIMVDDRLVAVRAGQLVLIDPDVPHNIIPREPAECSFITLMFTYGEGEDVLGLQFEMLLEKLFGMRLRPDAAVMDSTGALRSFFSYLEHDVLECGEKSSERVGYCLAGILNELHGSCLRREHAPALPEDMLAVQDYILKNMEQRITISDLTGVAHLSRSRLIGKFKQYCGMSPVDFVIHQRIEKAGTYLLHSTKRVNEIALLCGFRSEYYFSRTFKARVGMTPGRFRHTGPASGLGND